MIETCSDLLYDLKNDLRNSLKDSVINICDRIIVSKYYLIMNKDSMFARIFGNVFTIYFNISLRPYEKLCNNIIFFV